LKATVAIQAAVRQEQARIARELHDSVSQTFYAITLGAARALAQLQQKDPADVQSLIEYISELANTGQAELRDLITDIRSNRLASAGLIPALDHLATEVQTRDGLDVRLSSGDEPDVSSTTKEAIVMIVREALHNVVRHSAASRAEIVLQQSTGELSLLIKDNGRGFDLSSRHPGRFGLQSMRERAIAVGGTVALFSAVGAGTRLRVSIPVPMDTHG
jgi:signal transduction histidine kinase